MTFSCSACSLCSDSDVNLTENPWFLFRRVISQNNSLLVSGFLRCVSFRVQVVGGVIVDCDN